MTDLLEINCIKDVGCFTHCQRIVLPMLAKQTGLHQIRWKFRGGYLSHEFAAQAYEPLEFGDIFNEKDIIQFEIIQPDGTLYEYDFWDSVGAFNIKSNNTTTRFRVKTDVYFDLSKSFSLSMFEAQCGISDCNKFDLTKFK